MTINGRKQHPLNRWRDKEPDTLQEKWALLCKTEQERAAQLINDPNLDFPVLFALKDDLDSRGFDLSQRARIALAHIRNVLQGADLISEIRGPFAEQHDQIVSSLLWILKTGWNTIPSTDYVQVIDQTAIQVLLTYHQNWISEMVDLIIYRYKNRSQRHYLISALLETANPEYLIYLANYLLSVQSVESNYARKLLSFIPEVRHAENHLLAFHAFECWFEENEHYLVYTGETNDAFPDAAPYRIHYSAKYLGKAVDPKTGQPRQQVLPQEKDNYQDFLKMPQKSQIALSVFSKKMREQQPHHWQNWIRSPLIHQMAELYSPQIRGDEA